MSTLHRLLFASLLLGATATQAATMRYAYVAKGVGDATGGTLTGMLTLDLGVLDIRAGVNEGDFRDAGTMTALAFGGPQDGASHTETDMNLFADGNAERFNNFYDGSGNFPYLQLLLEALPGVNAIANGDSMPFLNLDLFQKRREIRFYAMGDQHHYELTSLRALDTMPEATVPLPNSAALALAGVFCLGLSGWQRAARTPQA